MIVTNQVIFFEQFSKYFVNVAQNLVDDVGETVNKLQDYLKLGKIKKKLINNLDIKKAGDIFDITLKLLKAASGKIMEPLIFLYNETIQKGVIPQN